MMVSRAVSFSFWFRSPSACEYRSAESPKCTLILTAMGPISRVATNRTPEGTGSLKSGAPRDSARWSTRWIRGHGQRYLRARDTSSSIMCSQAHCAPFSPPLHVSGDAPVSMTPSRRLLSCLIFPPGNAPDNPRLRPL